ncbi:BMC domain-containing protein [Halodesulfovibrio spirochaetisodalis]|uniref:Microcompartment protein n=1 Tax=Halodesulfovibrio spirochaetisodalis TaxID=1560234 RepID=A0A1B7XBE4_9BACT|nr:BMC domain-containing protein [Halodesulfovibrio spirochaetisodalis]OBQ46620.1 microcompartment protein [Halodesulfovibrio spirochaetisodalis]
MQSNQSRELERIIQETVPGKQVTIAHVIAAPMPDIYDRLGVEAKGALGILTLSPFETAIIAADIATKTADVEIGFLDRFTGSVVVTGSVESVETALQAVVDVLSRNMGFTAGAVTRS